MKADEGGLAGGPGRPLPSDFTLAGWTADTLVREPIQPSMRGRVVVAHLVVGVAASAATAALAVLRWPGSVPWPSLLTLAVLAFVAQAFPVRVSHARVSLGVGFLLAACLLVGPAAGAATVALVSVAGSMVRGGVARHQHAEPLALALARLLSAAGVAGMVYWVATACAFWLFGVEAPVDAVRLETVGASLVLTVGVYLLHNLASLLLSVATGGDVGRVLQTVVPAPALAEFLALPAALLLAVTEVRLGFAAFALLAWLYLLAAFLGWRSWLDRETLEDRLHDLELLHRGGEALGGTLDLGELVRRLWRVTRDVTTFDSMLVLLDDPSERLSQVFAFDAQGQRAEITPEIVAETEGRPEGLVWEPDGHPAWTRDLDLGETARARLRIDFTAGSEPDPAEVSLLDTLSRQAATALSNARLYRLANTDPLTGVAIRRYFERALRALAGRGEEFAIIMLDIDWFKQINDALGHRAGDSVLADLAGILVGSLRSLDIAVRYGGEEFLVLLPGASGPEAAAAAERVRRVLDNRRLQIGDRSVRYTASFGVAASTDLERGIDPMEVVWKADSALLEAKRAGKNQVVTYTSIARSRLDRPQTAR